LKVSTDYLLGRAAEMEATVASADRLHRHYAGLSTEYQEMADEFIHMLAQRAQQKKDAGDQ